jgi:hypothetical protein
MALGLCASAVGGQGNPTFVKQDGRTITVLPTGADDTANLQCAFDNAAALGPGVTVRLVEGTYHTQQIVANNFKGAFVGAGADKSVLTNLPNLFVTPGHISALPSATNLWPSLVSFVGGDFSVSDLGMHITGAKPTLGWTLSGQTFYELAIGFAVQGTKANALFLGVDVEGELVKDSQTGYNLINGIYFTGIGIGPETGPLPISGPFTVIDSIFRQMSSTTPIANVSDASIAISRNHYQDVFDAMEIGGLLDSKYAFSFNTVEGGSYGGFVLDLPATAPAVSHIASSEILVSNNTFIDDQNGVYLDATFEGGARCQVVLNKFQNVATTGIGIFLGTGTSQCLVAANSPTTIQNLGTDNVIVNKALAP